MRKFFALIIIPLLLAGCVKQTKIDLAGKSVLFIVAPQDFRDEEFFEPYKILTSYGAKAYIASKERIARSVFGKSLNVNLTLKEVSVDKYDAIIFVGGPGTKVYFNDTEALRIAKEAYQKNKIIAAICIAPSILANSGILEGKIVTAFPSEKSNLEMHGAIYTGKDVEIDGNIITASGPFAAKKFGEAIAQKLVG